MKYLVLLLLVGCAYTPTWAKANSKQRASGQFTPDTAYYQSEQYQQEIQQSIETVERLKKQIHKQYE